MSTIVDTETNWSQIPEEEELRLLLLFSFVAIDILQKGLNEAMEGHRWYTTYMLQAIRDTRLPDQSRDSTTPLALKSSYSMEDFLSLTDRFISAQDVLPSSRATYKREMGQYALWLNKTGRMERLAELKREDILAYKDSLSQRKKSSYTVSGYVVAVRSFYGWLESERIFPNVARGVKGNEKPSGFRKDTLSPDQLRKVLELMDQTSLEGQRDYALFNLLARTGLRTIEASKATLEDLRIMEGQRVLYIQGKGKQAKDEFVLLTEEAYLPLKAYISSRGQLQDSDPLFSSHSDRNSGQALTTRSLSRIVKEALKKAGLDDRKLTAHSLRHTAITLSIQGGASLHQAQAMARHKDPRTTQIYFHNLDRISHGAEKFISF